MGRLIVDADQLQGLEGGQKTAEVCDGTGRLLGRFVPEDEYVRLMYEIELTKPIDEEARRQGREDFATGRCVSTAQLLQRMDEIDRSLGKTL